MKITVFLLTISSRHGEGSTVHATRDDAVAEAERYCRKDRWAFEDLPEDIHGKELIAHIFSDESGINTSDDDIRFEEQQLDVTPPVDPVAAARLGSDMLAFARECFKVAGSTRTVDRIRDALSSAKGAVRHAENKAVR